MSQAEYATVMSVAQSIGIPRVKESVASKISDQVRRDILKIIGDSTQVAGTCHAKRLTVNHINMALEANQLQPLFGYAEEPELVRVGVVDALDVLAYADRQVTIDANARFEPVYPLKHTYDWKWTRVCGASAAAEEEEEDELTFESRVQTTPLQMVQRIDSEMVISSSKHVTSGEMQRYHQTSRKNLLSSDLTKREMQLLCLHIHSCIGMLMPYYMQFCLKLMKSESTDFHKLYVAVQTARALAQNPSLDIDIYLTDMLNIALSMLMSPKIGPKSIADECMLRESAAMLLSSLMDLCVSKYQSVQPRITNQLISAVLDAKLNLAEKYGPITALMWFGLHTTSGYLTPIMSRIIHDARHARRLPGANGRTHEAASRVYEAVVTNLGLCLHCDTYKITATGRVAETQYMLKGSYREVLDTIGSDILPYCVDLPSSFLYI